MHAETKSKIEKHIRKHRKAGGRAEGRDEAEMDLKEKPADRSFPGGGGKREEKVGEAAEEMKAKKGGRIKRASGGMADKKEVGKAEGDCAPRHAGRRHRASGGSCEANPFTSAMKGMSPAGRKTMKESKGDNV